MIYEPEEDSFMLKKHIKEYIKNKDVKVLDMGTGHCILAEEAQKYSDNILAVDINPEARGIAEKKNLKNSKEFLGRQKCKAFFSEIKFIESNLFQNTKLKNRKFDLILFNPPYLPELKGEDEDIKRITTGGKQGFEIIEEFLKTVKKHLNKNAKILLICSTLTGDVEKLFKKYGFKFEIIDKENAFFEKILLYELKIKENS